MSLPQPPKKSYVNYKILQEQIKEQKAAQEEAKRTVGVAASPGGPGHGLARGGFQGRRLGGSGWGPGGHKLHTPRGGSACDASHMAWRVYVQGLLRTADSRRGRCVPGCMRGGELLRPFSLRGGWAVPSPLLPKGRLGGPLPARLCSGLPRSSEGFRTKLHACRSNAPARDSGKGNRIPCLSIRALARVTAGRLADVYIILNSDTRPRTQIFSRERRGRGRKTGE